MLSRLIWNCSKVPFRKSTFESIVTGQSRMLLTQPRAIQTSCSKLVFRLSKSSPKYTLKSENNSLQLLRNTPLQLMEFSTEAAEPQLSNKDKLKRAVKEYGATVIVFHVSISLMSLGICYLAVSGGLNMNSMLEQIGLHGSSDVTTEASLWIVAYAVHKVLAPVRIGITLLVTPLIVRYLRKKNILKPPQISK
ncbi:protein FAM210B, mitochondrial [Nilaparvata lugens]|uniref:protein FAM210B, mitochondrial n=1 Tax=Nilaparvata lugens TaxID=108931 RepID=UPI00193CA117|nr:protein FAM210B, mitochondrial [Nilaparvata lugens]XP_022195377.2 protein FAM210B, mitochondrial [Nilaparvata lugens]